MIIGSRRVRVPQQLDSSQPNFSYTTTFDDTRYVSTRETLKMVAASFYLPKEDESKPRGEDAHFVCPKEQTVGVADGVGGWAATMGIDAGEYARELMANCVRSIQSRHIQQGAVDPSSHIQQGAVDPSSVLNEAYSNTYAQGSSTACIISLQGNALRAVNVGDSGFMVIRNGKAVYKSPVQQRGFNCPYQLGKSRDHPRVLEEMEVEVKPGDIVIAGTDGLFDNMHAWEIEETVKHGGISEGDAGALGQMACNIANLALYNSFDRFADTPYARAARKAGHKHCKGGKVDDITVIVAYVRIEHQQIVNNNQLWF